MIHHVLGLFTHPDQEWQQIRSEGEETIGHMYLTHTLILAAIPAVSAYIGTTQVGWQIGDRAPVMLTSDSAVWMALMSYIAMLAGVGIMGGFIHWMARTYDATPSLARCVAFATYTATPLFLGGLAARCWRSGWWCWWRSWPLRWCCGAWGSGRRTRIRA
ncbi:Yip1 family protein [Pseudomonas sp.]|uniref:Yip1 family protein n=1 Tax=Pseudomonas sp. TaxID=306 RepID=UPI003457EA80